MLQGYVNRGGSRFPEELTESKSASHIKEYTCVHKGDRKMKHSKRDTANRVHPTKSKIAWAIVNSF